MNAHGGFNDLVDKPYGYLFVQTVTKLAIIKTYDSQNDDFYFVLILRLRKCSLRKMMRDELVNDQIKRQVLEGLRPIMTQRYGEDSNGDV